MRKLMWITMGFGAACALGVSLVPVWLLLLLGAATLAAAGLMFGVTGRHPGWRRLQLALLGFFLASIWCGIYHQAVLSPVKASDGETVDTVIRVTDYSYETDYGLAAEGEITLAGKSYRIKFYLNHTDNPLRPGDTVTGQFRLRYTGYGAREDPTHHSADRIFLLGYPVGDHISRASTERQARDLPAHLRQSMLQRLETLFPEDVLGFIKALLLGDTTQLSYETDTALKLSGIRHIAAVSGLHISILFSVVYLLTGTESKITSLLGIPLLVIFAAMAGFSPSVTRACLMQGLMLLAVLVHREYDPPAALSFAALTMMAVNPLVITSVGFQLSVASVAGIFLFAPRITGWLLSEKQLGRWKKAKFYGFLIKIVTSVAVSLSALLFTTPLTAWYFGSVSLVSVVTNLLCLWLVTGIFCGSLGACILGALWMPIGKLLAWCIAWLIRLVLGIAGVIASFPLAAVYTESVYIVIWLVFCYVLLVVFLLGKARRPVVLICCATLSLCLALGASWLEPALDTYRLTALDVGQGQCILLQSGGKTYMVDCGGDYDKNTADKAAATLLSQGITRLDGLILTHYDQDHVGGAAYLLNRIPTDLLILPEGAGAKEFEEEILSSFSGEMLRGDEDLNISWGGASIRIFASIDLETSNESSLCVLFHTEKCDILITGDRSIVGEEFLLRRAELPQLTALVVGHHGSGNSTGEALLAATQPAIAVISVGEGNRYHHPAQQMLDRLNAYGCMIRRTDLEGTIILRG